MRRGTLLMVALVMGMPTASAGMGPYGDDGWPVDADGRSTAPPLNTVGPATVYPYWPLLTAEVQRLAMEHPDLVRLHSAGPSTLGLDLWMLEIADFAQIEQGTGAPLETREVVWVDGGTHSNEYSGVYFVAHLASFLTDEYATNQTARWIVENRHTWLMPMVNPDGSNAMGRLNANLVNINRNYPVVWDGEGHDAFMNNRGPSPASEAETQINIEWFNKTRPDYYASVHCCGNLWLYPYGEEGVDPPDNALLARVCDEAFPTVRDDCGPIWSTIYPASGSSVDTAYEYTGAVAFGYEMSGRGAAALWGQPLTHASVRVQEIESWTGILHAFLNVHRYGAYPTVRAASLVDGALALEVVNDGLGPLAQGAVRLGAASTGIPPLAPGAATSVRLEAPDKAGTHDLELTYTKRIVTGPQGVRHLPVTLEAAADGKLRLVAVGDDAVLAPASVDAPTAVPGAGALAVAAVVATALVRRRQR